MWGSRTEKNVWFPAEEEVVNPVLCEQVQSGRTQANRTRNIAVPRGIETMDVLNIDFDEDLGKDKFYRFVSLYDQQMEWSWNLSI